MSPVYVDGVCAPCIHGNLCRAYLNKYRRIYSNKCPHNCEFYEPDNTNFVYPYINREQKRYFGNNRYPKFPQKFIPATC